MTSTLSTHETAFLTSLRDIYRSWVAASAEALSPEFPLPTWVMSSSSAECLRGQLSPEQREAVLAFLAEVVGGILHSAVSQLDGELGPPRLLLIGPDGTRLRKDLRDYIYEFVPAPDV